jgi:hypothetical protein
VAATRLLCWFWQEMVIMPTKISGIATKETGPRLGRSGQSHAALQHALPAMFPRKLEEKRDK